MFPDLKKEETFKTELVDVLKDYVSKVLGITAQKGNVLKEIEHKEWFQDFKETEKYDPYYWSRLKTYLLGENVIPPLVNTLDYDSDKITDLLGNPNIEKNLKRHGDGFSTKW